MLDNADCRTFLRLGTVTMGTSPLLDVADEILQIDFGLHSCTVRHGFPTPDIPLLGIGPRGQEGAQN